MRRAITQSFNDHPILTVAALCMIVFNIILFYSRTEGVKKGQPDFKIFYTGAFILHSGHGPELYSYDLQARIEKQLFQSTSRSEDVLPYNHPPFELLVFLPLASLSFLRAYYAWVVTTVALAIVSGRLLGQGLKHLSAFWAPMPYLLIVCLFPFLFLLVQGQDSALALIVLVGSWLSLRSGSGARAGFFLGLGLLKFQVFIPLTVILACWRLRVLRGFLIGAAVVGIISVALVHPSGLVSYSRFLAHMGRESSASTSAKFATAPVSMPNLRGFAYGIVSHGADSLPPFLAKVFVVALISMSAVILVWAALRTRAIRSDSQEGTDLVFAFALSVSLLLSFHLQTHDLTLLSVPFALVLNRLVAPGRNRRSRQSAIIGLITLFYLTPLYFLLYQRAQVYLLGAGVFALAMLTSMELTELTFTSAVGAPAFGGKEGRVG